MISKATLAVTAFATLFIVLTKASPETNLNDGVCTPPYDPQTFRVPDAAASVIPAIPFTNKIKTKDADFGPLEQLAGTWISAVDKTGYGIHTTCMPSPGATPETIPGIFHFLSEQYTEELTFTLIEKGVRNRAGTNEQMVGAVKYNQSIKNDKGVGIHEETGMYMNLGDMYYHAASDETIKTDFGGIRLKPGDGGRPFVPTHKLARSGTIPHGNSILLLGSGVENQKGAPSWPTGIETWKPTKGKEVNEHLAISPSMGGGGSFPINLDEKAPEWVHDKTLFHRNPDSNFAYTQRILSHSLYPYSIRPDLRLRDALKKQKVKSYTKITLDTEFNEGQGAQGGIMNAPLVHISTPVTKMILNMWIEEVEEEDGETFLQLQYEQIMFFQFGFGSDGGTTLWPHIQVNTLRKKKPDDC